MNTLDIKVWLAQLATELRNMNATVGRMTVRIAEVDKLIDKEGITIHAGQATALKTTRPSRSRPRRLREVKKTAAA